MEILHSEVVPVRPGTTPDYDQNNPIVRLLALVEGASLAASREAYRFSALQFLFPIRSRAYGPSPPANDVLDPTLQDNKLDFAKTTPCSGSIPPLRGLASRKLGRTVPQESPIAPDQTRSSPGNRASLGSSIRLWLRVGRNAVPSRSSYRTMPRRGARYVSLGLAGPARRSARRLDFPRGRTAAVPCCAGPVPGKATISSVMSSATSSSMKSRRITRCIRPCRCTLKSPGPRPTGRSGIRRTARTTTSNSA